jgi:Ca2+-binding RTX toxin-like protein
VTGSAGADYIVGSVSANTISGGAGADYIIGGLGADTITIGSGANVIVQLTGASGAATASLADTITDFTAATAAIEIGTYTGDDTAGTGNYVEVADAAYADYAAVLTALNTAAATLSGTSAATLLVVFAGDTTGTDNGYVGIDRDGGGTIDEVIILTGILATSISVADIT